MGSKVGAKIKIVTVVTGIAVLGACATPPPSPPPPPPPPPPKVVVIPPRPLPPAGATDMMAIPQLGLDGVRQTVNTGISSQQILWNVRSGLNVAALNCLQPRHAALVSNYKAYLNTHSRELRRANSALQSEYRAAHGRGYRDVQDTYMTQVYNYFALPPALPRFCDAALEISREAILVEPGQLEGFSLTALPRMEAVFESFFSAYEQYRTDLAAWDARYGQRTAAVTYGPQSSGTVGNLDARYSQPAGSPPITTHSPPASTATGATYGPSASGSEGLTAPVDLGSQPEVQYAPGTGDDASTAAPAGATYTMSDPDRPTTPEMAVGDVMQPLDTPPPANQPQFVSNPVVQAPEEDDSDN